MKTYRSPMEKILDEQEMDTIITNPEAAGQNLFQKNTLYPFYLER